MPRQGCNPYGKSSAYKQDEKRYGRSTAMIQVLQPGFPDRDRETRFLALVITYAGHNLTGRGSIARQKSLVEITHALADEYPAVGIDAA